MENNKDLFEIFAGTYEEYLLGFKFYENEDEEYKLEQTVADHAHKASLRSISARGYLLATGGADEIIHVYNLDENREIGTLTQHTGTVTCLSFTSDEKHLISCSEDGSIAIYRVGSWIMEKVWAKAHKCTHVNCIAVHPSNKMAFSVGNDGNVRTWNLIEGNHAFVTDISHFCKRPELVVWSPDGNLYAIPHENEISVFSVDTASVRNLFKLQSKIISAHFFKDDKLCVGDSDGYLEVFDLQLGKIQRRHQVAESRIKAISSHNEHIIVATSQGLIAVYELSDDGLKEMAKIESSCRITCIAVSCRCHRRERKKKNKKEELNGEIKTELVGHINKTLNNKSANTKPNREERNRKVVCFPSRQAWVVEEQET